jgi:CubicO group peptidase (beta-lactamase class C family)
VDIQPLTSDIERLAVEHAFSGVVRVDAAGSPVYAGAFGFADRANEITMTLDTRIGVASGSKGFTALMIMRLVEDGVLDLDTRARELLGSDLPLIDDTVTVEHLLAHRSGIGDYLDEDDDIPIETYVLTRPVHELATTEAFLPLLEGHPQTFEPGSRFSYCNGGFVVLALLAERASGEGFHDLVTRLVIDPAGLTETGFPRTDALPGGTAVHYVELDSGWRSNILHLPVRGTGDGGAYTTAGDVHRFWTALFAGQIVRPETLSTMVRPRSTSPEDPRRYGLGFWLHETTDAIILEGYDAGVSFRTAYRPGRDHTDHRDHPDDADQAVTFTVMGTTSEGAWPIARLLAPLLS